MSNPLAELGPIPVSIAGVKVEVVVPPEVWRALDERIGAFGLVLFAALVASRLFGRRE